MKHIYEKGKKDVTLLLLHGTGGNEYDLIPLAKHIDSNANILSLRGNITEHGMSRFFKRVAIGVFDQENLKEETKNLYDFIDYAAGQYSFDRNKVIAIGYSNGANIAANLMLTYSNPLRKAILFHPMVPSRNSQNNNLDQMKVFVSSGRNDQMVSQSEVNELIDMFKMRNADVKLYWTDFGHQLNEEEINQSEIWYNQD